MKDSFKGQIVGTVERVRPYSKGEVVTVAFKANPNAQFPERVTVWAVGEAGVVEGQRVSVTGQVSWKVEEYNGKWRAQVSLNFPTWGDADYAAGGVVPGGPVEVPVQAGETVIPLSRGGDVFPDDGVPF